MKAELTMREILTVLFLFFLLFFVAQPRMIERTEAQQFATNYFWADSVLTTTSAIDSVFVERWEQLLIKPDTIDVWFRAGAPDTGSWASRDWTKLSVGESITFGAGTKIVRLEWKSDAGTGNLFMNGIKRSAQY